MDRGQDLVRRIKDSLDIVDVVGSYVELNKRGSRYTALCPFHAEKAPSFTVNRQGQFFHCFGCKKSGDIFDFVMAMEGVSFPEALKILGDRCGISVEETGGRGQSRDRGLKTRILKALEEARLFYAKNLESEMGARARQYIEARGFPGEAVKVFGLGYAPEGWRGLLERLERCGIAAADLERAGLVKTGSSGKPYDLFRNRLMIPIFDMQGRVVGFGGRVLDGTEPKYINSPETEVFRKNRLLYGLDRARQAMTRGRTALIVEGYTDVIMAHLKGVDIAVATLGTALTAEHARLLRRMADRVILLFDGDSAGVAAAMRGVEILLSNDIDVAVVVLEEGSDPCDFFRRNDADRFWRFVGDKSRDFFDFTIDVLAARMDLTTDDGRSRAARELLRLAGIVSDPIRRDLLLHRISETLGVRENLLRGELIKETSRPSLPRRVSLTGGKEERGVPDSRALAEEDLIRGLLMEPALVGDFKKSLAVLRLEGEAERKILEELLDQGGSGPLDVKELLSSLREEDAARSRLIAVLSEERRVEPEALVCGALDFLDSRSREREYRRLKEEGAARDGKKETVVDKDYLAELDRRLRERQSRRKNAFPREETFRHRES